MLSPKQYGKLRLCASLLVMAALIFLACTAVGSINTVPPFPEMSTARPGKTLWYRFCTGMTKIPFRWVI